MTHTKTDRQTNRETYLQPERQTGRQRDIHIQTSRQKNKGPERHTGRQSGWHTKTARQRHTYRETYIQTDRQK